MKVQCFANTKNTIKYAFKKSDCQQSDRHADSGKKNMAIYKKRQTVKGGKREKRIRKTVQERKMWKMARKF